jgi:protein-S-isoprenylcysteine O-methyltransferase Ste14
MSEAVDHAQVRIHPPVLILLHLAAAFLLARFIPLRIAATSDVRWSGILFVVLGLGLATWAVWEFAAAHTSVDPHGSVSSLLTKGPYRFTRNPIYLGMLCILIGFPLWLGNYWGLPLALAFVPLINQLVIRHEEIYLEKKFGQAYRDFKAGVRRWL